MVVVDVPAAGTIFVGGGGWRMLVVSGGGGGGVLGLRLASTSSRYDLDRCFCCEPVRSARAPPVESARLLTMCDSLI